MTRVSHTSIVAADLGVDPGMGGIRDGYHCTLLLDTSRVTPKETLLNRLLRDDRCSATILASGNDDNGKPVMVVEVKMLNVGDERDVEFETYFNVLERLLADPANVADQLALATNRRAQRRNARWGRQI